MVNEEYQKSLKGAWVIAAVMIFLYLIIVIPNMIAGNKIIEVSITKYAAMVILSPLAFIYIGMLLIIKKKIYPALVLGSEDSEDKTDEDEEAETIEEVKVIIKEITEEKTE